MSPVEKELLELAVKLGPEMVHGLAELLKNALNGASEAELKLKAEQLAVLAAYKATYHRT